MVEVTVERGIPLEVLLSRIRRENGLHIIQVHRGVVKRHGKLERVKNESWVLKGMEPGGDEEEGAEEEE
jgi:hypothetical protein